MATWYGDTPTLARARFDLDGVPLAIVTGFSVSRNQQYQPVYVAGQLVLADAAPVNVTVQGSFNIALVLTADAVVQKLIPSTAGSTAAQIKAAIDFLGKNIKVWDIATEKYIYEIQGYIPGGIGMSFSPVGSGSVQFAAQNLLLESEMA